MNAVLILAAVAEGASGVVFVVVPSLVVPLLFGEEAGGVGMKLMRLIGIALIALAVACWPDRDTRRAFLGMLTYGLLAMLCLLYVGFSGGVGVLLWPAVAAHAGLSALLVGAWRKERQAPSASG